MKLQYILGVAGSIASITGLVYIFAGSSPTTNSKYNTTMGNIESSHVIVGDSNRINLIESNEETDLYLYFSARDTMYSNDDINSQKNKYLSKDFLITENIGESFEAVTGNIFDKDYFSRLTNINFTILNRGKKNSKNILVKLLFPDDVNFTYIGSDLEYQYRKDFGMHELLFDLTSTEIKAGDKHQIIGGMIVKYFQFENSYKIQYVISDSSGKENTGELTLNIRPDNVSYATQENAKARFYIKKHSYDKALIHIKNAIKSDPKHPAYPFNAAVVYLKKGNNTEAEKSLKRSLDNGGSEYHRVWGNIGALHLFKEEYLKAENALLKALELNPESEGDKYNLETARIELEKLNLTRRSKGQTD